MVVAVSLMLLLEVYSISLCSDLLHQYQQLVPDSEQSEIYFIIGPEENISKVNILLS